MYRLSSGHLVYSFRVARPGREGGPLEIFGWQCAAATPEYLSYTSGSAEFC